MSKQTKITKSARGEDCQIRLYGVCSFDPETTVFCHLGGGGMASKASDAHGAYGCSGCHDEVDGRTHISKLSRTEILLAMHQAVIRTQLILIEKGLLEVK